MDKNTRTNDTQTNGSGPGAAAGEAPAAAPQHANGDLLASGSLTNAEVTALSRERLQTLLSILPPAVAAILITNRPPMPPHVEYDAHRKLVAALAQARAKIPSVPMDKTVDYVSKRTGDHVHYTFASLDSIHKTITGPLSEHGLVLQCVFNGDVIVVLLSHEDGGLHLSWLPLPDERDIKDLATQITMRRRYLTNQLIAIVADEDTGERDIAEPRKDAQPRSTQQGQQRPAGAPPANRGRAAGPAASPRQRRAARQPHQRAAREAPQGRRRRASPAPHRPERAAAAHHRGAQPPQRCKVPQHGRANGRRQRRAGAAGSQAAGRRTAPGQRGQRRPAAAPGQPPAREAHQRRHASAQARRRRAGGAAQAVPGRSPGTAQPHQGAVQRGARQRVTEHVPDITNRAGRACA